MRINRKLAAGAIAAVIALVGTACSSAGSSGSGTDPNAPVTLTWWHNGSTDPLKSLWQQVASDYHTMHPNVTIQVDPIQNEQFQTKIPLALQSSNPPSIYQQWGGGQQADQVTSGKLMDMTQATSSWIGQIGKTAAAWQTNGKQFGLPYEVHIAGFWYRKDLFAQAGITSPPATIDDLMTDIGKLKAANITPIALGSQDKWPDAFYWQYFVLRECPPAVVSSSEAKQTLTDPCFTKAGEDTQKLLATNPFQPGFLGTPAQTGAGSSAGILANGKAAMELQGDWEASTMASLTSDKQLESKMAWFPFPSVPGGAGDQKVALSGGDGFSCTSKATSACTDFLKYIDSVDVQKKIAADGIGIPVNPAAASSLTDPTLQTIFQYLQHNQISSYSVFSTNVGNAFDDAVANFFAGKGTPQSIPMAVTQSASQAGGGNR